jgi:alpha-aminoadipic semialdehyde synthase
MKLGIIKETKNKWERRVALNPAAVKELVEKGFEVKVEPSEIRVYTDAEYAAAGAHLCEDLGDCDFMLGVKEIPLHRVISGIPHLFFSHTIKGQEYNMPLLQYFLDTKSTLLDYERIIDEKGRRLVFFGTYAGNAGMVDTLWGLGQRLKVHKGIETPFTKMKHAYEYESLEQALAEIKDIGDEIATSGLPEEICPLNVFLMGYGHVANGCREVLDMLPVEYITPDQLPQLAQNYDSHKIYVAVFKEEHMVARKDGGDFELQDYFAHHDAYKSIVDRHLAHCSVYMNAIYWEPDCPVFLPNSEVAKYQDDKLIIIGDITCDIEGSVECTIKATKPDNPIFIFDAKTGTATDGLSGCGVANCAVDNLPCEFSKEASDCFSNALMPFMEAMLRNDYTLPVAESSLPTEIKPACIAHQGALQPQYTYLAQFLKS